MMSTEMTPMKRYSTGLTTLKNNLTSICEKTELNKTAPKSNYDGGYSKGVASDYVLIFKDKYSDASFALVFEYIGLSADKQRVVGSVKLSNDGDIKNSFNMTLDEFKTNLNALNKDMEAARINRMKVDFDFPQVLTLFSKHMLKEVIDLASDLKSATSDVSKFLSKKLKELENEGLDEKITAAEKSLDKAQRVINKKIADSPLTAEREQLLERIKEIDKQLKIDRQSLTSKADIVGKKQAVVDTRKALADKQAAISKDVDEQLEKYPVAVRKRVKQGLN
jgi:hypothetical protein